MLCEADFQFCPRCGAARIANLPPVRGADGSPPGSTKASSLQPEDTLSSGADRRHVTVLFADVAGFTTFAERLDPEDVRAFQSALFEMLGEAVARYDGFVEKFVGDAVMAVFGAPVAHGDDPARALNAALDMLECSERLSETWAARLGQAVKLHIGVHTGPVVAGNLGSTAGAAYAVTGDTVNTTARLLAAASGTILVSGATYALTQHRFVFDEARDAERTGQGAADRRSSPDPCAGGTLSQRGPGRLSDGARSCGSSRRSCVPAAKRASARWSCFAARRASARRVSTRSSNAWPARLALRHIAAWCSTLGPRPAGMQSVRSFAICSVSVRE